MIGRKIIFKETLDSTNNYAAKLLQSGQIAHGTVIMSGEQTAGKGQRGAVWAAEPYKNLIFTVFLEYDNLAVIDSQSITHFVSLALIDLLGFFGITATIKWPNDILIENRKIAGILIENQLEKNLIKSSIIGIGLNVNQTEFGALNATSMALKQNKNFSIEDCAKKLIDVLQEKFYKISTKDFSTLKKTYLQNLWLFNQNALFQDKQRAFKGKIVGTDGYGRLIIETESKSQVYDSKEIIFLNYNTSATPQTCD